MQPIDFFSEPGLRVGATADLQSSSLVVQVHHAACDGKAVLQFFDDFVRSYVHVSEGKRSPMKLAPATRRPCCKFACSTTAAMSPRLRPTT